MCCIDSLVDRTFFAISRNYNFNIPISSALATNNSTRDILHILPAHSLIVPLSPTYNIHIHRISHVGHHHNDLPTI